MTPPLLERLGLLRAAGDTTDPGPAPGVIPPKRSATVLTPTKALALDGVFRAVQVIQTAASQLTLDVWADRDRLDGDTYPRALSRPFDGVSQTDLIKHCVTDLALGGNAYVRVLRNPSDNKLSGLQPLDRARCYPVLTPSGRRYVRYAEKNYRWDEILHLRFISITGEAEGLGPIQACRRMLTGALDVAEYGANFTRAGGVPTGVLTTDQPITKEQATQAKDSWNDANSLANGVAVVGRGIKFDSIALSPADMQFLEQRNFDEIAIARLFGIPAHLMLVSLQGNSMTYQNIVSADTTFIRWTVMQYLREIETQLTKVLPLRQTTRFNLDAVLRADTATRMKTHKTAIEAGIYDAAEARRIEGLE